MTRDIRDILAEAMRWERLGPIRPAWSSFDEPSREVIRRRADVVIRMLRQHGISLVYDLNLAASAEPPPAPNPISRSEIHGEPGAHRIVRSDGNRGFEIVVERDGVETIEQAFTVPDMILVADRALRGNPDMMKRPGSGRMLAAAVEIYRAGWPHA